MDAAQQFSQGSDIAKIGPPACSSEFHWYALFTRARYEKRITTELQEKGVNAFLPLVSVRHRWSDRFKSVQLALFPCYTFVQLETCRGQRLSVLQTPGVLGFVGAGGVGLPIRDKDIEDLRHLLDYNVTCTPYPFLRIGHRVRIRGGCLEGVEGILVGKNSDRTLVVSVELIQRSVAVRIDGFDVEPV